MATAMHSDGHRVWPRRPRRADRRPPPTRLRPPRRAGTSGGRESWRYLSTPAGISPSGYLDGTFWGSLRMKRPVQKTSHRAAVPLLVLMLFASACGARFKDTQVAAKSGASTNGGLGGATTASTEAS